MKKSAIVILCCGAILLGGCSTRNVGQDPAQSSAGPVLETTVRDGKEYYLLTSEADLQAIGKEYPLSGNYMLDEDVVLSEEWVPIGSPDEPFTGIFDGNGYTIDHLTVTKKTGNMGFFGAAKGAVIKDLVVEHADVDVLAFFPIVYDAEDTEITGCSINDTGGTRPDPSEDSPAVYSFEDEEAMIGQLMDADHETMTLADFQAQTLAVFHDAATLDSVLCDLEDYFEEGSAEARMVACSLPATCSELLSDGRSGTITTVVDKERTAGRVILDTVEFSCRVTCQLTYTVSDETVTVSERDRVLEKIHDRMQAYMDGADEKTLASLEAGEKLQAQLSNVIGEAQTGKVHVSGTVTEVSLLDKDGGYQTVFPK